jgi:hypothetical protein
MRLMQQMLKCFGSEPSPPPPAPLASPTEPVQVRLSTTPSNSGSQTVRAPSVPSNTARSRQEQVHAEYVQQQQQQQQQQQVRNAPTTKNLTWNGLPRGKSVEESLKLICSIAEEFKILSHIYLPESVTDADMDLLTAHLRKFPALEEVDAICCKHVSDAALTRLDMEAKSIPGKPVKLVDAFNYRFVGGN